MVQFKGNISSNDSILTNKICGADIIEFKFANKACVYFVQTVLYHYISRNIT